MRDKMTAGSGSGVVDLHQSARGVAAAVHWVQTDRVTGKAADLGALPAPVVAALTAAKRLADQVLAGDNVVLVRGGAVDNDPVLPVIDLHFLDDRQHGLDEAVSAQSRAYVLGWPELAALIGEHLASWACPTTPRRTPGVPVGTSERRPLTALPHPRAGQ